MPNFKTYSDGKAIYSVDMMLAYVNTHKHPTIKLQVSELMPQLEQKVWDHIPKKVLEHMDTKKYQENAERIRLADLTYPILVTGSPTPRTRRHAIVDGYHRVAKAYLDGAKDISAYVFDAALMKRFIIDKDMNFVKVHEQTPVHHLLELWSKRFC